MRSLFSGATILFRPYVFLFLAAFLFSAVRLLGWPRTWRFWLISWITAFLCEFSSTRIGIPFGWYHYTGSTVGQELYLSNIPFMDSLSFSFLLYASYCLALAFTLPSIGDAPLPSAHVLPVLRFDPGSRTSWPVFLLTVMFFAFIDMVIDPVALRGDRWFLGKIDLLPGPGRAFRSSDRELYRLGRGRRAVALDLFSDRPKASSPHPGPSWVHDGQNSAWLRTLLWSAGLQPRSHLLDRRISSRHHRSLDVYSRDPVALAAAAPSPSRANINTSTPASIAKLRVWLSID